MLVPVKKYIIAIILVLNVHYVAAETANPTIKSDDSLHAIKAPYRVLFSNDTTNILSCVSPYHKEGDDNFTSELIQASVDETAGIGIDVHIMQPGLGWIPWWKSKEYPAEEHYRLFKERTGHDGFGYGRYMAAGGDMVQIFVDRCREKGLSPFISLRLNDGHHVALARNRMSKMAWMVSRFYEEHPDWRIGPNKNDWDQAVMNWAIPEVREHKYNFLKEICEGYDIDGLELDYMRHMSFFALEKTTSSERAKIMTEFISRVRALLDRTSKPGQRRWLCVRVPCFLRAYDRLGIDIKGFVRAGVDMVTLSCFYFTEQQTDLAMIRKLIPEQSLYLEMCNTTQVGPPLAKGNDSWLFRRTTKEQFYTAAHLAYARGANGVSAFNFAYYRQHGKAADIRGPWHEPPFEVFGHLGNPQWLAQQPQHYILAKVWPDRWYPRYLDYYRQMPKFLFSGKTITFRLDMAPPEGGWKVDGRLRIQTSEPLQNQVLKIRFNKQQLEPSDDISEPYANPYPQLLGNAQTLRAWTVPRDIIRNGPDNIIEVKQVEGEPVEIMFLDIALPATMSKDKPVVIKP